VGKEKYGLDAQRRTQGVESDEKKKRGMSSLLNEEKKFSATRKHGNAGVEEGIKQGARLGGRGWKGLFFLQILGPAIILL